MKPESGVKAIPEVLAQRCGQLHHRGRQRDFRDRFFCFRAARMRCRRNRRILGLIVKSLRFSLLPLVCLATNLSLLFVATVCSAAEVDVSLLSDEVIVGKIVGIADRTVTVETAKGAKTVSFDEIAQLGPKKTESAGKSAAGPDLLQWVGLVDGSRIACRSFRGKDDQWKAELAQERVIDLPPSCVEYIQFGRPVGLLGEQWERMISEPRTEDQLAIVRPGDAVDIAPGLIGEVTDDFVEFSFDGQMIQAPRKKLLGALWYRVRNTRIEPTIRIRLKDGSKWEVVELMTEEGNGDNRPIWKSRSGVAFGCGWSDVESIDFSVANVVWLASEKALESSTHQRAWMKYTIAGRDELLGPRFVSPDGSDDAKSKDLSFAGPGKITFRTPEGFPKFVARIHRSESSRMASSVICEVWDGDVLAWSRQLMPTDQEAVVEVPVTANKKLSLVVRSESELMMGTKVFWDQPRLTR